MTDVNLERIRASRKELYLSESRDFFADAMRECEESNDETTAAQIIRKRRNELLAKTDSRMSLDRIGLTTPAYTLTGLIDFVRTIMKALTGDWAKYRQALRDIPDQPGFPFSVVWPEEPED